MNRLCFVIVASLFIGLPLSAAAQNQPWQPPPQDPIGSRWPGDPPPREQRPRPAQAQPVPMQAEPAQTQSVPVQAQGTQRPPASQGVRPWDPDDGFRRPAAPRAAAPPKQAQPARAIACSGVFAKNSSHLKLAQAFDSRNVTYTDVDGPEGSRIKASVLFPADPKRRLEVIWQDEAARSDMQLIAINGQSTWTAPKGLRLGLTLAALEKLNGKPFQLSGFDQDNVATVKDWQGGALASLPGGCKVGVNLRADPKAEGARGDISGDKTLMSSDELVRAAKPSVSEILIGY